MEINGKVLIVTDIHLGLKGDSVSRLAICEKVVDQIVDVCKSENIGSVIFCGDWNHSRTSINVKTLDVSNRCIDKLTKHTKFYFILGNHDIFNKNTMEVNSINVFRDKDNFILIDKVTDCTINGAKALLCPWISDYSGLSAESYDFLLGHFDIPCNFLINQYVAMNKTSEQTRQKMLDNLKKDEFFKGSDFETNEDIGSYVDLLKQRGTIFSGHIHGHKEFKVKNRKFIFVGSPYQQTLGEAKSDSGYYIIDSDNSYSFRETVDVPKHVNLRMTEIMKVGVDKFDFSIVSGNIIHKIYDLDIDRIEDSKITKKITDFKPYEELVPDYDVAVDFSVQDDNETTLDVIQKSEMEYLRSYIDSIDVKSLENENIEPKKLYGVMTDYYNKVIERK